MMQINGLSIVLEDQAIAPPTYSYMAPKHLHFDVTKASHLESLSFSSLWHYGLDQYNKWIGKIPTNFKSCNSLQ